MSRPAETSLTAGREGGGRIVALDALRGLSVAGIAAMNVIAFSMPSAAYVNPRAYGGSGLLETALWALSFLIVEDKFRALFAMMFGAGVAILLDKPAKHPLAGHYARMVALFAIGLAHATLLASNDILRVYAVAGLVLPLAVHWRPKVLFLLAAAIMAMQVAVSVWSYWDWIEGWWRGGGAVLEEAEYYYGADPRSIGWALEQGRETFSERIERRLTTEPAYTLRTMLGLPSSLAAMLIGIGLWRNGLLKGEWSRARLLRLFLVIGLPSFLVLAAMAAADLASGFDPLVAASIALIWSAPFDLALAVGWAALAMAAFAGGAPLTRLWAAAGRMALTNYLLTSLTFAWLVSKWGLGLFGEVSRVEAYALCLLPIALMLTVSPLWLSVFRQGPAEWLWRSLAQARPLPIRRAAPS